MHWSSKGHRMQVAGDCNLMYACSSTTQCPVVCLNNGFVRPATFAGSHSLVVSPPRTDPGTITITTLSTQRSVMCRALLGLNNCPASHMNCALTDCSYRCAKSSNVPEQKPSYSQHQAQFCHAMHVARYRYKTINTMWVVTMQITFPS